MRKLQSEVNARGQERQQLSAASVVQILGSCVLTRTELEARADVCSRRTPNANAIRSFGLNIIVMERGERDLADIIAHDLIAGVELADVQRLAAEKEQLEKRVSDLLQENGAVQLAVQITHPTYLSVTTAAC